jgi:hypothetical protein
MLCNISILENEFPAENVVSTVGQVEESVFSKAT